MRRCLLTRDIHHREPMTLDLRPAAKIDDTDFFCFHSLALRRREVIEFVFYRRQFANSTIRRWKVANMLAMIYRGRWEALEFTSLN